MFEREYRELSDVPRWTIIRTIQKQNVAEHTFYVTLYAGQIADTINWEGDRAQLLDMALRHDVEEMYMSDIPGPSKRAIIAHRSDYHNHCMQENMRRFNEDYGKRSGEWRIPVPFYQEMKAIIKVADLLDECFFLATDQQLGNKAVMHVLEHSMRRLWKAIDDLPCNPDKVALINKFNTAIMAHRSEQSIIPTG